MSKSALQKFHTKKDQKVHKEGKIGASGPKWTKNEQMHKKVRVRHFHTLHAREV